MNRCGEKVRGVGGGQRPEAGKWLLKFLSTVVPKCEAGMESLN